MVASHARAYHRMPEFQIVASSAVARRHAAALSAELGGLAEFGDYHEALGATGPMW